MVTPVFTERHHINGAVGSNPEEAAPFAFYIGFVPHDNKTQVASSVG